MQGLELSNDEITSLRIAHKRERNKKFAYRINAVILLGNGWTQNFFRNIDSHHRELASIMGSEFELS